MIVVDASLLVYFWGGAALWRSEFRNAVLNLTRARRLASGHAVTWAREAEIQMAGREYSVESHSVLTLATQSGCSAYDCEYVALAEDLDIPLVTFDEQVSRAFPDRALAPEAFIRD